mmetsp:Transcript_19842/g.41608  ORF Transcript_19842/g.41608 Transcript_19842/m.41608 type:complete len:81 (+) Transcript_19842:1464-1706(+)
MIAPPNELNAPKIKKQKNHESQCADMSTAFNMPHRHDWNSSLKIRKTEIPTAVGPKVNNQIGNPSLHDSLSDIGIDLNIS